MGYNYYVDECDFRIDEKHFKQILQDSVDDDSYDARSYAGLTAARKFIEHLFDENGFDCVFDTAGNLFELQQKFGKLREQEDLFMFLGPYVTEGSYLNCRGEDGSMWRWRFTGRECFADDADAVYRVNDADCPLREILGEENTCAVCPFGLVCLCDGNPRLQRAQCSKCGEDVIVDTKTKQVIAGITCTCQPRTFLLRGLQK